MRAAHFSLLNKKQRERSEREWTEHNNEQKLPKTF